MLQTEGAEKIQNKVRGEFWKNEAEDTTQHGAVGSNGRIRKTRNAGDTRGKKQSSESKGAKQNAHDGDTRHGIQST